MVSEILRISFIPLRFPLICAFVCLTDFFWVQTLLHVTQRKHVWSILQARRWLPVLCNLIIEEAWAFFPEAFMLCLMQQIWGTCTLLLNSPHCHCSISCCSDAMCYFEGWSVSMHPMGQFSSLQGSGISSVWGNSFYNCCDGSVFKLKILENLVLNSNRKFLN